MALMDDCIFCKIVKGEIPSAKIYEDDKVLAFLDIAPINPGHTLVIPKAHFENIFETPEELVAELTTVVKKVSHALQVLGPEGMNVAMNNGKAAGQDVFHSHIHVIPRYQGDGYKPWHSKRPYREGEKDEIAKKITQAMG